MKTLEIPEVNAKVSFVWMDVETQRKMSDEELAAEVAKVRPTLIFEEVNAPEGEWTAPCEAAQPAYVPPEVLAALEHEIDEMRAQLTEYGAAQKTAGDELSVGYFESMVSVLADEIGKKEATLQNVTIPQWLAKFVYEKIVECGCCTVTLGKVPAVKVLFFGKPEHKTGLVKAMTELKAVVAAEDKIVRVMQKLA
ncbi:MAG: hypothetical protein RBG13Loki_0894 [Promethearchaeota archaeon CR_4]|nr:MAG: hypothetical protein RBG13Loki_0894 [Candidatus Lokiarchaeota archaeon CR_4]